MNCNLYTLGECVKETSIHSSSVQRQCFMNYCCKRVQANMNNFKVVILKCRVG
jgi:hypothetical protein